MQFNISPPHQQHIHAPSSSLPKVPATASILVIDDDPAILTGVATLLDQAEFRTICAASGLEALSILKSPPYPDLVILDVMLPDIDGYTLCRSIRQVPPYIPVLMLSARDEVSAKVVGLELGADEYVTKPFDPCELLARVRAMLRLIRQHNARSEQPHQPLVCGPVTLWKDRHYAEVRGQPVSFAPKEWALLEFFVEHPNKVFGRETLLCQIWGSNFVGDTRTVDVHIQRLRMRIELDPALPRHLQTVRGFGYRFVPNDKSEPSRDHGYNSGM